MLEALYDNTVADTIIIKPDSGGIAFKVTDSVMKHEGWPSVRGVEKGRAYGRCTKSGDKVPDNARLPERKTATNSGYLVKTSSIRAITIRSIPCCSI